MIKTFTGLTMAAAMAFTVGTTRPQTVPQPGSPGTQSGSMQQPTTGGQGNNAVSTEKK